MKGLRKRIEDWLTAVTFAEAGEHETALRFAGGKTARKKSASLDDLMTAITFAEAGLTDAAREFLGVKAPVTKPARLELPGVKIWCGMVPVEEGAYVLPGVKVWYGMAALNA